MKSNKDRAKKHQNCSKLKDLTKKQRIEAFGKLGTYLIDGEIKARYFWDTVAFKNPWYTKENVFKQLDAIGSNLTIDKLSSWTAGISEGGSQKTVALILAGNIPLVGFHDILSVLIAGFNVQIKPSSDDAGLTQFVLSKLIEIEPLFAKKIQFVDRLADYDLTIATGSNNSARYFEYYFGKKPHIIRKNRNSVGVLRGGESKTELQSLGHDILDYFGLGCRSVSKIFIPQDYDISAFFEGIENLSGIKDHFKYNNNYDYNKSIYLINGDTHYDNGFLLLKEDDKLASPLAAVHFERYRDLSEVMTKINSQKSEIQCVTSSQPLKIDVPLFPFGQSQCPALDDYADGIDTLQFLEENQ